MMKTLKLCKTTMLVLVALGSLGALAAPPTSAAAPPGLPPPEDGPMAGKRAHLAMVVAISEALELSDADALKLGEKLKGVEARRQPVREQMREAMKAVRAAAGGDAAALAQVDANIQKVLDGRAQMAAMDKELFATLSKDLAPQKKAKLALVLAHLGQMRGQMMGGPHGGGRRGH
jgi:hypothetical protein